jgi:hypothetical protein
MPSNYTGSTAGITARQNVTISEPAGTDVRSSASVRTPLETLANVAQYLMTKSGLLDVVSTWTAKQTMSGGVGGLPAPTAGGDAATKTYADGLITTLLAAAQTWAAKQTFSVGQDVTGTIALVQAALQQIVKTGAGKLQVGTAAGNANDLELLVAGAVKLALLNAGGIDAKTQRILNVADPSAAQDAATKNYVDQGLVVKAPSANPTFIGAVTVPDPINSTDAANKEYVDGWATGSGVVAGTGWTILVLRLQKAANGLVYVSIQAQAGSGAGAAFATLPSGYRPGGGGSHGVPLAAWPNSGAMNVAIASSTTGAISLKNAPVVGDTYTIGGCFSTV